MNDDKNFQTLSTYPRILVSEFFCIDGKPSCTKKPNARIKNLEMKNLHLENEKLQEEVSKIKLEKGLLKVKKNPTYYDIKLQILINEHPEIVSQMLNDK